MFRPAVARLLAIATALSLVAAAAPAASASSASRLTLAPACHSPANPYGFTVSAAGLRPNSIALAELTYGAHSYQTFAFADSQGEIQPYAFTSPTPFGAITVRLHGQSDQGVVTLAAQLASPCLGTSLSAAMCGDGSFSTYWFASPATCDAYVGALQQGTAEAALKLRPSCTSGTLTGFWGLVLGLPAGTPYTAAVSDNGNTTTYNFVANRFGGGGPVFDPTGATSEVSVTISGGGHTITKALTSAACS